MTLMLVLENSMTVFWKKHEVAKATLVTLVILCAVVFVGHSFVLAQSATSSTKVDAKAGSSETSITSIALTPILYVIRVALTAVYFLVGNTLIKLGGYLASLSLELNNTILTFDPPFVLTGWVIFRDIANLGFVFGIIVIAMATILRIQGYQAQRILLKLIAAALLVNFSLVIAGSVLRIAQVFSDFFMNRIAGGSTAAIGAKLVDQLGFARIGFQPDQGAFDAIKTLLTSGTASIMFDIASLGVIVAFAVLTFITLLAFAGMLFIRYFQLSFLLMLSPIVWLLWIFPHTKGYWQKWWKNFLHWVFYAPFMLLFVWLALTVMASGGSKYKEYAERAVTPTTGGGLTVSGIAGISFGDLMQNIMAMAILLGGMKVAQSMGYGGTALVMNSAQKMGGWAKTKARRGAARAGHFMYRPVEKGISKWTPKSWIGKKTAGFVQRKAIETGAALQKEATGGMEEARKRYGSYDKDHMQRVAGTLTGPERDQVMQTLAEKGWIDKDFIERMGGEGEILDLKNQFVRYGKGKDFESIENAVGRTKEIQDALEEYDDVLARGFKKGTTEATKAMEELSKARQKFLDRLKGDEWANVGKAISGKVPKSDAEREYFAQVAEHINRDPSGKAFFSPVAQLKGHNLHDFVGSLYATTLPDGSALRRAFEGDLNTARSEKDPIRQQRVYESILDNVVQQLDVAQKSGTLTRDQEKLLKRVRRTVVDDIVGMTTMAPLPGPAPTPGVPPPPRPAPGPPPTPRPSS